MQFNILTYNNRVGIVTDAILLKELIYKNVSKRVEVKFIGEDNLNNADVGIWIQNYDVHLLSNFKKNIYFINEEWAGINELSNLHLFDYVICKSKYARQLLEPYCDVIYIPFISKDYYDPTVTRHNSILHFVGRSIQKNTELVLSTPSKLTIIDPYNRYNTSSDIIHITSYQTNEQIKYILNSHQIHICISLYESWGHYMFEGLSTGAELICSNIPVFKEQLDPDLVHFMPTQEKIDLEYMFDRDNIKNIFPLRKSFYVDPNIYIETIKSLTPKGSSEKRKLLFKHILDNNSKLLVKFLKNI